MSTRVENMFLFLSSGNLRLQMVTCDNEGSSHGGFVLGGREDDTRRSRAPSVSSLSLYKQKIDALFDDNRSVTSLPRYGATADAVRRDSKVNLACFRAMANIN